MFLIIAWLFSKDSKGKRTKENLINMSTPKSRQREVLCIFIYYVSLSTIMYLLRGLRHHYYSSNYKHKKFSYARKSGIRNFLTGRLAKRFSLKSNAIFLTYNFLYIF